jgi:hypothetical protein
VEKLANSIGRLMQVSEWGLNVDEATHRHLRHGLTYSQLHSKIGALKHLSALSNYHSIFMGQWHGMLPHMLHEHGIINSAIGIELDHFWANFSEKLNYDWDFKSIIADVTRCNAWEENVTSNILIVNTSSEHMNYDWLNFKKSDSGYVYLQSTDFEIDTHINTVTSTDPLVQELKDRGFKIEDAWTLPLEVYTRYCVLASW